MLCIWFQCAPGANRTEHKTNKTHKMNTNGDDFTRSTHVHWSTENDGIQNRKEKQTQTLNIEQWNHYHCDFYSCDRLSMQTILPSGYILMVLQPLAMGAVTTTNRQTRSHTHHKSINLHKHCANRLDVYYHNIIPYHWQRSSFTRRLLAVSSLHWHQLYSIHFRFSFVVLFFVSKPGQCWNEKSLNFSVRRVVLENS